MINQRFKQALHDIVAEDLEETTDLWPKVRVHVESGPRRRRFFPTTRHGWAGFSLLLILAFSTAAYAAVTSFLDRVVEMDPQGIQFLIEDGLVKEMDLSQTEKGITVTLEWAYADVNRIVIGYTVKHPGDRCNGVFSLTDRDGSDFPPIIGGYGHGWEGLSSQVVSFNASSVQGIPERLDLRLNLQISTFNLPGETPAPPASTVNAETGVTFAEVEPMRIGPPEATFEFDFSVPFHSGREIKIGQSADAAGVEITLERVTIAPSDARLEFCFAGLDYSEVESWIPLISIDPGKDWGGDSDMVLQGGRWISENCYEYDFAAPLQEQRGLWMVTVTEMIGDKPVVYYNEENEDIHTYEQIRLGGPWTYRFHVP